MSKSKMIQLLFAVAGVYDGVLGLMFLLMPEEVFFITQVEPPNHFGYVQFPAALLLVFAALFFAVGARPQENRNLIPYGILLKIAYCGVIFGYWLAGDIPDLWKPFAVYDAVFGILFTWAYFDLRADAGSG